MLKWDISVVCQILKMKKQHDRCKENSEKNPESQMGFETTTVRDLVVCSKHLVTGDSMVSKSQFVGLDWNRITRLRSQVRTGTRESRCHIKAYQDAANQSPKWYSLWRLVGCILIYALMWQRDAGEQGWRSGESAPTTNVSRVRFPDLGPVSRKTR